MKLSSSFIYSVFENLPFRRFNYIRQSGRKSHYQPKKHKFVFKPVTKNNEKELLHTQLLDSLQRCSTVEEQIKIFHSMVRLPNKDINCRHSVCQDLERTLRPYFPSCSIHPVGSSINGLGFKGCDLDLSMQFPSEKAQEHPVVENAYLNKEVKVTKDLCNKAYPPKTRLLTIRKILQDLKYDEPLVVIPGRCPILNFTVQNISCDLSVNNSTALQSTKLMLLCGKLDERVTPLMQIILYWAKNSNLVGGPSKFKTYAIFLMVIYFLQTRRPPVLPSVKTMLEKTEFLRNLDNFSYDVEQYMSNFDKTKNSQTVEQLLKEFFVFYGNYDFSHIICPLNSISVDRKYFTEKVDCSDKFELNTICIQDPLNLEWNVTTGVNWKHCKNFLKAIISVWEKYQNKNYWTPGLKNWGLASLIDSEFTYESINDIKEFSIDIPFTAAVVDHFKEGNFLDLLEQASSNVIHILTYCLQFQCYALNHDTKFNVLDLPLNVKTAVENLILKDDNIYDLPNKNIVTSQDNCKNNLNPYLITQYICATKDTWSGRNTYISVLDSVKNIFDNEQEISKKIETERGSNDKEIFCFLCECHGVNVENNVYLYVRFTPLNNDRFIPKLMIFLKEYIPKLMDKVSYKLKNKTEQT